jgi:hypothetical protein
MVELEGYIILTWQVQLHLANWFWYFVERVHNSDMASSIASCKLVLVLWRKLFFVTFLNVAYVFHCDSGGTPTISVAPRSSDQIV